MGTMSVRQVAEHSGITYAQALAAIHSGTLKARKKNRAYAVTQTEAERFKRKEAPDIATEANSLVSASQAADKLDVEHKEVISLIHSGVLKAEKVRGRYRMDRTYLEQFVIQHTANLEKLREKYISLYWQGLTLDQLKVNAREEIPRYGVVFRGGPVRFVDMTIYDHLMEQTRKEGGLRIDNCTD